MAVRNVSLAHLIKGSFDSAVLARGKNLLQNGHVRHLRRVKSGPELQVYQAQVVGSSGALYNTEIVVEDDMIFTECDCPYGIDCKHSAAVALAVQQGLAATPGKMDPKAQVANVDNWLANLKQSRARSPAVPQDKNWNLVYLIDAQSSPPMLVPAARYRKKNGEWGRIDSIGYRHSNTPVHPQDQALFRLMDRVQSTSHLYQYQRFYPAYELAEDLGFLLLRQALATGRALDMETEQPLREGSPRRLQLHWKPVEGCQRLAPALEPELAGPWQMLHTQPLYYKCGNTLGVLETPLDTTTLELLLTMPPIPPAQFQPVCIQLAQMVGTGALELPADLQTAETIADGIPKATLLGAPTPVHGFLPALRLSVGYGPHEVRLLEQACRRFKDDEAREELQEIDGRFFNITRRFDREYALTQALRARHLVPYDYGGDQGELWVPSEIRPERHLAEWHKHLPALQALFEEQGWAVEVDASYQTRKSRAHLNGEASNHSGGWFDLQLNIGVGGGQLETSSLMSAWIAAGTPAVLPLKNRDGHWDMVDMSQLQPLLSLLLELYRGGGLDRPTRLPAFKVMQLEEAAEAVNIRQPPSLKKLRETLKNFRGLELVEPDKKLHAQLRDYQKRGLSWLMFLRQYGFGGILADDMGLGKTLQTLAFIQKLKAARKLTRGALIVAPTSLIWNWQREAEKFTPNLRCLTLHGLERKTRFDEMAGNDLIITSYGLIQRDFDIYQDHHFDLLVLDEAQNIKNNQAKTTGFVKQLPADMRLCLTGTPLENHLGELWSLMDFALPGLLGDKDDFRRHFRTEIEQAGNAERSRELSARIAPFMLRRTKGEVVRELPQKTEILQTVELAKDQRALYEGIRISMEKRVRDLIKQKGVARSHIEFLDALLKLRQACIDPRLVKLSQAKKVKTSAKMEWLTETLPELVEEGRKLLIFSQFTEMLDLIDKELTDLAIPFVKLTGRTRNRQKVIDEFQNGDVPVFLISLKAGGAGLNLTAADTVIHVDPWWNPAVENQATDRAHRIGQNKPVFVYKLVANGTVEEKIQALQQQKQALADALFDGTGKAGLPQSGEELLALFGG